MEIQKLFFIQLETLIIKVRYEDVASNPYEVMETLFDFLGLDYPSDIDIHIAQNTGKLRDHKTVQIHRNSEKISFEWRKKINTIDIDSIEASCETVIEKLGYAKYAKISSDSDVLEKKLSEIWP